MISITSKYVSPFVRRMIIYQVHSVGRVMPLKGVWTRSMAWYQCPVIRSFYLTAAAKNTWRCSSHNCEGPPDRCYHRNCMAYFISSPEGID